MGGGNRHSEVKISQRSPAHIRATRLEGAAGISQLQGLNLRISQLLEPSPLWPAHSGECAVLPRVSFFLSCLCFLSANCSVPLSCACLCMEGVQRLLKHSTSALRIHLLCTDIKLYHHAAQQTLTWVTCDAPKSHGRCGHTRWDTVTGA